ncbi:hypothetical protein ACF07B_03310 [Streptomyces sp. NPDC015532]|uniref:hypothetical protein n=1 Tax=Streptomyces sp. NPDC015532 TaxID=3364960 RepID=UPI0036F92116
MSEPQRFQTAPFVSPLMLVPEPEPSAGCDVCRALDTQRTEARARGDLSRVTDINIEIRRHAHGEGS